MSGGKVSALLAAYDAAWRLALGPLRAAAEADARWRKKPGGRGFLPPEWRSRERLLLGPSREEEEEAGEAAPEGTLWMHAASLGECQGLWALAESLGGPAGAGGMPGRLLLTAQTAAGVAYLENRAASMGGQGRKAPAVSVAPFDHPELVRRFLGRHRVACLVLYEVELWPNFIRAASARGIPVLLVSARMTARALARYRILRGTWASLLDRLDWIQAQGPGDAERFRALTRAPVEAGADLKLAKHREARLLSPGPGGPGGRERLAFLSLHLRELAWFLPELPALMERFPITVLPRRPAEMETFRRRLLPLGFALHGRDPGARHVLVDSLGRVGEVLPACGSAFVGGSLVPAGCHNLWEPLLAGLKIYFGPSTHNQERMARLLIDKGVAEPVTERARVRAWGRPDPGVAAACREIALGELRFLEESEAAARSRIEDAVARFYLNSVIAKGRSGPRK